MPVIQKTIAAIVKKAADGYDFVLSDATVDRYGDIIVTDGWELSNFKNNPIALFNHSPMFVIGSWSKVGVRDDALRGTLKLAPEGTSERIDEIRRLVDAGVLRAVSVGFTPIAYDSYKDGDTYGYKYTKQELVECSLVSIPANPNAIMEAKSLHISEETQRLVFSGLGRSAKTQTAPTPVKETKVNTGRAGVIERRTFALKRKLDALLSKNTGNLEMLMNEQLLSKAEALLESETILRGR